MWPATRERVTGEQFAVRWVRRRREIMRGEGLAGLVHIGLGYGGLREPCAATARASDKPERRKGNGDEGLEFHQRLPCGERVRRRQRMAPGRATPHGVRDEVLPIRRAGELPHAGSRAVVFSRRPDRRAPAKWQSLCTASGRAARCTVCTRSRNEAPCASPLLRESAPPGRLRGFVLDRKRALASSSGSLLRSGIRHGFVVGASSQLGWVAGHVAPRSPLADFLPGHDADSDIQRALSLSMLSDRAIHLHGYPPSHMTAR